jgi:hypothetical protein
MRLMRKMLLKSALSPRYCLREVSFPSVMPLLGGLAVELLAVEVLP